MERKLCFPLFAVLLFVMLNSAQAQTIESYSEVGGTLILTPPFSGAITSILWKHDGNLVVELVGNEVDYYGKFRGMATLDTTTGRLEIKNMNKIYAGWYTVEINNQVQSQEYNVELIKKVPKPEVAFKPLACSPALLNCTMTCDGDTSEAGPVTYSWREGDGDWIPGEKDRDIKNDEETKKVKTFSCQMKNPVSEEESEPQDNPFFQLIPESSAG
ncbi:lymphocyte function-associated antigen 3-like [Seriola lalandi dorsalis]|uniref:lymphocyte function-associated antigen 3-like n=1 Tax=Seriola lalandi dorsalis TaxID=1841481 RepID=UPI000C6F7436|nr:lymphocyte function-associated antigen 3-like [Seriola lalandi dorsalis]